MVSYHILSVGNALFTPQYKFVKGNTGNPTITLVVSEEKNLLVDPGANGLYCDKKIEALKLEISLSSILGDRPLDYVFITHPHLDHCNLAPLISGKIIEGIGELIPGVFSFSTLGHHSEHKSLEFIVEDKRIVVAGDAVINKDYFYAKDPQERIYRANNYSIEEIEQTLRTMEKIRRRADMIIPGHGNIFKVRK